MAHVSHRTAPQLLRGVQCFSPNISSGALPLQILTRLTRLVFQGVLLSTILLIVCAVYRQLGELRTPFCRLHAAAASTHAAKGWRKIQLLIRLTLLSQAPVIGFIQVDSSNVEALGG